MPSLLLYAAVPCLILHAAVLEVVAALLCALRCIQKSAYLKFSCLGFEAACINVAVLAFSGSSSVTCWTVWLYDKPIIFWSFLSFTLVHIELLKLTALYSTSRWAVYAGPQKGSALCFFRANSRNPRVSSMIVAVKPPCTMVGKPQTSLQHAKQFSHGQCLQMN